MFVCHCAAPAMFGIEVCANCPRRAGGNAVPRKYIGEENVGVERIKRKQRKRRPEPDVKPTRPSVPWVYPAPVAPTGWVCPKCGRVNAPSVKTCPCSTHPTWWTWNDHTLR